MITERDVEELREMLREVRGRIDAAIALITEELHYELLIGTMSTFGGPSDDGVSETEGLALCEESEVDEFPPDLFLSEEEAEAPGLARRLNPAYEPGYIAMRWNYDGTGSPLMPVTSRDWLQDNTVAVRNPETGLEVTGVQPIDWGPNEATGRIADLSPGLAERLGLSTDDVCEVRIPVPVPPGA